MSSYIQNGNSITVPKGSTVEYTISLYGYHTQTGNILADETKTISVSLEENLATLTINPTPSDAKVTIVSNNATQNNNSITVECGSSVSYKIEKTGYITIEETIVVNEDTTLNIELIKLITLTINPTPSDAVVTLTADGYTQVGNSITVANGTEVSYVVEKIGYKTTTNTVTPNEDTTIDVVLELKDTILTINPTPSDAKVTLTADGYTQVGNSIEVAAGTEVTYVVEKDKYITQTDSVVVSNDITLDIVLQENIITLTINPTPSDAVVTLTADGYTQEGNSIAILEGTPVNVVVSKDEYNTYQETITITENKTIDIELEEIDEKIFTIIATPENATIEFEVVDEDGIFTYDGEELVSYSTN